VDLPAPIGRARSGLRREFVACYREEFAFVWRALLRLGVARSECDDAAQDVFVTAYRRWPTLREAARRRAWLFGIVRRVASRHRRTGERRERRIDALSHAPKFGVGLEEELARREAWTALADFLDVLDEEKRAAFVLGEVEELGRTEIGDALGINPNTAYSRLQAARRSFFAHFAAYDDDGVAHLLARAGLASTAPPEARDRTWAGIAALLGAPLVSAAKVSTMGWAAIAVAIAATGGVAAIASPPVVTTTSQSSGEPDADVQRAAKLATPAPATTKTISNAAPLPAPRRSEPSLPSRTSPRPEPPTIDSRTIDAEVAVRVAARSALVAGDLAATQRHLDEHARTFGTSAALVDLRARIERDLTAAAIDPRASGDSKGVEDHP
jgi:RNA polymerase sigma-70 factor (ECF subfamily)